MNRGSLIEFVSGERGKLFVHWRVIVHGPGPAEYPGTWSVHRAGKHGHEGTHLVGPFDGPKVELIRFGVRVHRMEGNL